jgi:hypothetical protein
MLPPHILLPELFVPEHTDTPDIERKEKLGSTSLSSFLGNSCLSTPDIRIQNEWKDKGREVPLGHPCGECGRRPSACYAGGTYAHGCAARICCAGHATPSLAAAAPAVLASSLSPPLNVPTPDLSCSSPASQGHLVTTTSSIQYTPL